MPALDPENIASAFQDLIRGGPPRRVTVPEVVGMRVSEVIWPGAWATVSQRQPWFLPLSFAVFLGGIPVVDGAGMQSVAAMAVGGGVIGAAAVIAGQRSHQREAGGSEDVT